MLRIPTQLVSRQNKLSCITSLSANFASFKKNKGHHKGFSRGPEFSILMRNLYKRSHPDLLRHSHPDKAEINDNSMQILNSILDSIKRENDYPPQQIMDIPFYIKVSSQSELELHILEIRTPGGECKKQLTNTFVNFFQKTGILTEPSFVWDREYFPLPISTEHTPYSNVY